MGFHAKYRPLVGIASAAFAALAKPVGACGLALVLATDVSLSVDEDEYTLQMLGIANALRDVEVQSAFEVIDGGVAVTLVQWAGRDEQFQSLEWAILRDSDSLEAFADQVAVTPRAYRGDTAPGSAIAFSILLHQQNPWKCDRKVIDLSGDGSQNIGRHTGRASKLALEFGITINGLVILSNDDQLEKFYQRNVLNDPSSFLIVANGFDDFPNAIRKKLLKEIPMVVSTLIPR